jgi:hypothetical protein
LLERFWIDVPSVYIVSEHTNFVVDVGSKEPKKGAKVCMQPRNGMKSRIILLIPLDSESDGQVWIYGNGVFVLRSNPTYFLDSDGFSKRSCIVLSNEDQKNALISYDCTSGFLVCRKGSEELVLDVIQASIQPGATVGLYNPKQPSEVDVRNQKWRLEPAFEFG